MAAGGGGVCHDDASGDLYGVLGVKKECSDADLRLAYRKLAMVLGVRQLGERGGGQGAVPGDPGRILRALRLRQAAPLRRRRLRQRRRRQPRRARCVGDGRLPRRDGRDDEPGDANRELRGTAAAVRGHVPGRPPQRVRVWRPASDGPPSPGPETTMSLGIFVCSGATVT